VNSLGSSAITQVRVPLERFGDAIVSVEVRRIGSNVDHAAAVRAHRFLAQPMLARFDVASRFEDLVCWQLSDELKRRGYAFLATGAMAHDRDSCYDLRRSLRSAPANTSEGFGRRSPGDFAHFLSIASGSLNETRNHLRHCHSEGAISDEEWSALMTLSLRAVKATDALREYLVQCAENQRRRCRSQPARRRRGAPSKGR
jgi:four helix bundle protein